MKEQPRLAEMKLNDTFDGYLYVVNADLRTAYKENKGEYKYLFLALADSSAVIRSFMWAGFPDTPAADSVVYVRGRINEHSKSKRLQLMISELRAVTEDDDYDLDLLKPAPQQPSETPEVHPSASRPRRVSNLSDLNEGECFDGYLLTRSVDQRKDKNGKTYLDMNLCDAAASINAKAFAKALGDQTAPAPGSVLYIVGTKQTYNGTHIQLIIDVMRPVNESDVFDMSSLIACAPYPPQEMRDTLYRRAEAIRDNDLRKLVLTRLDCCGDKLNYYPAASRLHHAEMGGLLHHTSTMLKMGEYVCMVYPQLDADLVAAGVILHDLCKLEEMDSDTTGIVSDYTAQGNLLGHLVTGVAQIDRIGRELGTRPELLMMVEHMILSHHDLPEYGSPKPPMFPEAEVLHTLDLLDARMFEMDRELKNAVPGGFTDKIWSLDRKLYRRKESVDKT